MKEFPGLSNRKKMRPHRERNYRIKFRDNYHCQYPKCIKDYGLLVVQVKKREDDDDSYSTRCPRHMKTGVIAISPGQWNELDDS